MKTNNKIKNDRWITVAEMALEMSVSKMTVYRLAESGELTYTRFGKSILVDREYFHEYIKANTFQGRFDG